MSRELLFAITNSSQTVSSGSVIPLTTTKRRVGQAITLDGNTINLRKVGYYKINSVVTFQSTAGSTEISFVQDGDDVSSSGNTSEATTTYTLSNVGIVKVKCCCQVPSEISLSNTGSTTLTVSDAYITVEYLG